ncbi:MAG: nitroreductase family protein [Actinobacteria bacterium]|nr:nitroreductase family protein [Actinomycetota bacterium]
MVRNYTSDPVDPAVVARIVDAARRAPSAGFSQGQRFIVVTDQDVRSAIADAAGEPDYVANGFDPWISSAPVHIVVCVRENDYHERYREPDKLVDGSEIEWPVPYWWVDAGASLMLVLVAAADEGLGAGFVGFHALPSIKSVLGIPDDVTPIGVVTIGHPAPDRRSGSLTRGRKPRTETIYRDHWGRSF